MTDTQVIRKKISQNCINSIEEKIKKNRLTPEEIQNIVISEITKVIKEEN